MNESKFSAGGHVCVLVVRFLPMLSNYDNLLSAEVSTVAANATIVVTL